MKTLKSAISLALSVLLVASALFIGATAETTNTVTATELPVYYYYGTNNANVSTNTMVDGMAPTYGNEYSALGDLDPLVPEFPSTRLTFGWSKEGNKYLSDNIDSFFATENVDFSKVNIYRYFETAPVTETSLFDDVKDNIYDITDDNLGLMLYIKLDPASNDTGLYIESQTVAFDETTGNRLDNVQLFSPIVNGQTYYLMAAGSDEWVAKSTNETTYGYGEKAKKQALNLSAGYEGWIYLPRNAFIDISHSTRPYTTYKWLYRINFYLNEITKDTIAQFSNIMLVNGDVTKADSVSTGDKTYAFASNRFYSGTALDVNGVEISRDGFYEFTNKDDQLAASYGADNASLSVNMGADKNVAIVPDSYYTATPLSALTNPTDYQRPKPNSNWNFTVVDYLEDTTDSVRYHMDSVLPDPFNKSNVTLDETTIQEQYDDMFDENGTYIGGFYREVKTTVNATTGAITTNRTYASAMDADNKTTAITDKSILFYIKHTYDDGVTAKNSMNLVALLGDFYTMSGKTYYVYDCATGKWNESTFKAPEADMKSGISTGEGNCYGYIEIPVDFEGWFLIPYDSYINAKKAIPTTLTEFRISPECFGNEYGELDFGDVTIIDNINPLSLSASSLFISGNTNSLSSEFPFNTESVKTEGVVNSANAGGITGLNQSVSNYSGTFETGSNFAHKIENGVYTTSSLPRLEIRKDGAKIPVGENDVAFIYKLKNASTKDLVVALGCNYVFLDASKPYYLLSDLSVEWETKTTSAETTSLNLAGNSRDAALVTIPAGFEGYISLPFSSFDSSITKDLTNNLFQRISFVPIEMEGSVTISNPAFSTSEKPTYFVSGSDYVGINNNFGTLVPYDPANTKNITIAYGVLTNESDALYAEFKANGTAKAGEAIMFYAKNAAEAEVIFKSSVGDNTDIKTYSTEAREWTLVSPDGKATLPANFEGWVKIAVTEDTEFNSINLIFNSLTNGFAISDIMVANYSVDLEFTKRGTTVRTGLFYEQGDFNIDGKADILDLIYNKYNPEIKHPNLAFEGDKQFDQLRAYLLSK